LFCVLVAWAIHAAVDWDWEMPVVSVLFFALGGCALANPHRRERPVVRASRLGRLQLGLGCLILAVAPAYVWLSQRRLDGATYAFAHRDCQAATQDARASLSVLSIRAQPYEIIGYCDVRDHRPALAIAMIKKAISLDPNNEVYHYDLAVIEATAGIDPRAQARRALTLNPRDPVAQALWHEVSTGTQSAWQTEGRALVTAAMTL
jgi:hypothetical protein